MRKQKLIGVQIATFICFLLLLPLTSYEINAESSVSYEHELDSRGFNEDVTQEFEDSLILYADSQQMMVQESTLNISEDEVPNPSIGGEIEIFSLEADLDIKKSNKWDIKLTKKEIDLLAKIVWLESQGESDEGQQAVIEVIFNRMIHWDFEGSLQSVLSHRRQFCTWKSRNKSKPTDKEYENINKVLNGETDILTLDTVYFSTKPRNNKITEHIGGHYFCKYEFKSKEDKR